MGSQPPLPPDTAPPGPLPVVLAGASGRTGSAVARALATSTEFRLVGAVGQRSAGRDLGELVGTGPLGVVVAPSLAAIAAPRGSVYVDFTHAEAARQLVPQALARGWPAVVGTTGLLPEDLDAIHTAARRAGVGACVIANFSVGAALAAHLARLAASVMPDLEIVELHGSHKRDRPSGTAAALARDLEARRGPGRGPVPIHSVRLPGLVAHQEVLLGRPGELVTIRHDVFGREAYVEGVLVAIRRMAQVRQFITRLEDLWTLPGLA